MRRFDWQSTSNGGWAKGYCGHLAVIDGPPSPPCADAHDPTHCRPSCQWWAFLSVVQHTQLDIQTKTICVINNNLWYILHSLWKDVNFNLLHWMHKYESKMTKSSITNTQCNCGRQCIINYSRHEILNSNCLAHGIQVTFFKPKPYISSCHRLSCFFTHKQLTE